MKIVLDNNVFISGTFWHGVPHQILQLAEENKFKIYSTLEILKELFGVLQRKKFDQYIKEAKISRQDVFQMISELVYLCGPVVEIKRASVDVADDKFLACAVTCQAGFIISGDKYLLKLKEFQGIAILTPKEFVDCFKKIGK